MKILYLNYLYDSTQDSVGASVHVRQFVDAMQRCGHEIKSVNLNVAPQQQNGKLTWKHRVREQLKKRLKRYVGQLNQFLKNGPLFFREWKLLSAEKPDVLLIRYNLLNFTAPIAAKLQKIPVVLEVNSPHAFERKHLVKDVWQLPFLPFLTERLNFRLADGIITVSHALKKYYVERKVSDDKIFVIPNGVNTERFSPEISSRTVKRKYALKDRVVLGFVGSFHHWHGVDNLLHLIEQTQKYKQAFYLLVGDGPLRQKAEDFVVKHHYGDRVAFTGYVVHEDVPAYIAAMDIVLAPYPFMEFFYFSPLKLFEYLSAGKAVIASDIGQISEIIVDGENGFLYNPHNLDEFVEKTGKLIEEPALRKRFGEQGRAAMVNSFTWEQNAKNIIHVIKSLNGYSNGKLTELKTRGVK
ncbi:MAG: glycosyltransferase family 4 protein [bacterium]